MGQDTEGQRGVEHERLAPRMVVELVRKVVGHALNPNELLDMARKLAAEGPWEFVRKRFAQPLAAAVRVDRGEELGLTDDEFGLDLGDGRTIEVWYRYNDSRPIDTVLRSRREGEPPLLAVIFPAGTQASYLHRDWDWDRVSKSVVFKGGRERVNFPLGMANPGTYPQKEKLPQTSPFRVCELGAAKVMDRGKWQTLRPFVVPVQGSSGQHVLVVDDGDGRLKTVRFPEALKYIGDGGILNGRDLGQAVAVYQPNWYVGRTEPGDWEQFLRDLGERHPNLRQVGSYSAIGIFHFEDRSVRYASLQGGGVAMFEFMGYGEVVAKRLGASGFELLGGEYVGGYVGLAEQVIAEERLPDGVELVRSVPVPHLHHKKVAIPFLRMEKEIPITGRADQIVFW